MVGIAAPITPPLSQYGTRLQNMRQLYHTERLEHGVRALAEIDPAFVLRLA